MGDDITYTTISSLDSNYINDTGSEYTINISSIQDSDSNYSFAPTYDSGTITLTGIDDQVLNILNLDELEEMCNEYPGLKNVYEKLLVNGEWFLWKLYVSELFESASQCINLVTVYVCSLPVPVTSSMFLGLAIDDQL